MKRILSAVLLTALIFALEACSVKEKRCNCPCYLMLDFSKVDSTIITSARVGLHSADSFDYTADVIPGMLTNPMVIEVPRTDIVISVVADDDGRFLTNGGLVIPKGEDCPPLYMHTSQVNTERDTVTDTVRLHKSYCALSVGMVSDGKSDPFEVGIKGNICGYADDGSPMDGDFLVIGTLPAGGHGLVNLPRQIDASLSLQILTNGKVIREFALGEYIESSGYDWAAPDLEDVDVLVDFALAEVAITIDEWETRYVYGVEI